MNLLLLLSAFLTALTGAITGVRPTQVTAQEQIVSQAAAKAAAVAIRLESRPVQGWPAIELAPGAAAQALRLGMPVPAFGQRRRE